MHNTACADKVVSIFSVL